MEGARYILKELQNKNLMNKVLKASDQLFENACLLKASDSGDSLMKNVKHK